MASLGHLWDSIRQQNVANLLSAPASVPGLFCAFVVASAVSWSLLFLSWWLLALRSRLVRGYSTTCLLLIEMASANVAALGHFVLLFFAVYRQLPPCRLFRGWRLRCRRSGTARSPSSHGQESKEMSVQDSHSAVLFDEEAEGHARGAASTVAIPVGSVGGLQQRATSRLPASPSLNARTSSSGAAPLLGDAGFVIGAVPRNNSFGSRKTQEQLARHFPYVVAAVTLAIFFIHVIIHITIPSAHRQSQELLLGLVRVCVDVLLLTACEISIALRLEKVAAQSSRSSGGARVSYVRATLYLCGAIFAACTFYTLTRFFWLVFTVDTLEHLKSGVMHSFDICAKEGMRMDPGMATSWVWPALTHRRLFNFWTGSENCSRASGLASLSFLDAKDHVLLVSPLCPGGARPHVYLHRPENNEFSGSPDVRLPETERGNLEYHRQLEALYGTAALAASRNVTVNRDATTHRILSVEVDPETLPSQPREPRTPDERAARQLWPQGGNNVLLVPLGLSAAYTVLCEKPEHEEYHLFPLNDALLDAYSVGVRGVREAQCVPHWRRAGRSAPPPPLPPGDEPAGNVFVMLFDAVSRQEVRRALPKLSRALADFAAHGSTRHHVVEAEGAMTLGVNTAANLVPFIAGITANAAGLPQEAKFTGTSFMDRAVFVRAKEKYGDTLSTAFTSAFCHDLFEYLMGYTVPSSGAGGRVTGIDRYMYQPFCHLDYSGVHSNFIGPYSILRRCMAGEAVWDHMVNYTEAVVERQLENCGRAINASSRRRVRTGDCHETMPEGSYGKHFFHVMYMTEGHEGTHSVMPLVDESLTRFFHDLRFKLKFFDNPLNTFILLADHGNHMGHYFQYTRAGQFERGTPPTVLVIHPEVLNRIDRNKGRGLNVSIQNLLQRTQRVSTPLDVYLTLADLLNVRAEVYYKYGAAGVVHPASLFDMRDAASTARARNCSQFSSDVEHYPCPLDFCRPV
ncbi:hypothetical protein ABB37_02077 [Leptomonas pyrrhocoris]|uniref:Uncharacterized protein n=1 Tax=Leptomonas pyrrhocoris TaxID=157538 RepID=A0A0N0DYB1_LEPPY|nr:hypothetical protein ABB37_02077 [Leptomonas pyrrhocoris]XP_015662330.1 hypothetical protein ABB37_02077 [Leptomonas pyrrhocoris]KPA83890.1 hypothetical protein ABB37_02077 [Leptomonas pyrrhocoris]KPA83891.1 hypothetical protein ABB37_02077 [Leptomonas pyrrhocoris]|eukprot:XP_015662329.1 hypothetical protein ABB37_02077 [Leptomonas pyrrhocoris]